MASTVVLNRVQRWLDIPPIRLTKLNNLLAAVMVSSLPTFRILIAKRAQSSAAYVHKPSTNSSSPRDRFSPAIRLDPIHQHHREFSDVETLTRQSDEHYPSMAGEHDIEQKRTSMIMGIKTASQSSIPKGNIRVKNEFVSCPRCLWYS